MNTMPMPSFQKQIALQRWLQHGDAAVSAFMRDERREARLRIYADAYRLRLLEVLGNDFPALHVHVGDEVFAEWSEAYLRAHPSTHKSARGFGQDFPGWLDAHAPLAARLAHFEWQQGEAFDAADAPRLALETLAALPPSAWPHLRLRLQPALRLLRLPASVPALAGAFNRGETLPPLREGDEADWLLWRRERIVHWRRLDADEAALLQLAQAGATFAQLCERLQSRHDDAAMHAIGLLKRWLEDGLVAATDTHPD